MKREALGSSKCLSFLCDNVVLKNQIRASARNDKAARSYISGRTPEDIRPSARIWLPLVSLPV